MSKKLLTTEQIIQGVKKTIIWPYYQMFKNRLEIMEFKDIKSRDFDKYPLMKDKQLKYNYPIVVNEHGNLKSNELQFHKLSKCGNCIIGYKTKNQEEVEFFLKLEEKVKEYHPVKDLSICFVDPKMRKFTDKVTHLFLEDVRIVKPNSR